MAKYGPLRRHLESLPGDEWRATFSEIEAVLGASLPPSARNHQAWWSNDSHGSHSHARAWLEAGWKTARLNLDAETVEFHRETDPLAEPFDAGEDDPFRFRPDRSRRRNKYDRLRAYLESFPGDRWETTFSEVEAVLGEPLPYSARRHRPWWSNGGGQSQARAWRGAGWKTARVNLEEETLEFRRDSAPVAEPSIGEEDDPSRTEFRPDRSQGRNKYDRLRAYLESRPGDLWEAPFAEVEAVLGEPLPYSARRHRPWWSNGGGHPQTRAWRGAGWKTAKVDLQRETLEFRREFAPPPRERPDPPPDSMRPDPESPSDPAPPETPPPERPPPEPPPPEPPPPEPPPPEPPPPEPPPPEPPPPEPPPPEPPPPERPPPDPPPPDPPPPEPPPSDPPPPDPPPPERPPPDSSGSRSSTEPGSSEVARIARRIAALPPDRWLAALREARAELDAAALAVVRECAARRRRDETDTPEVRSEDDPAPPTADTRRFDAREARRGAGERPPAPDFFGKEPPGTEPPGTGRPEPPRFETERPELEAEEPGRGSGAAGDTLSLGGVGFRFVAEIRPVAGANGLPVEERPHLRFDNTRGLPLNRHGDGPFCRFSVSGLPEGPGVYAVTVARGLAYVGIANDLRERWSARGYARIHPRNCFRGGQSTNCKVNHAILTAARGGRPILLWIHESSSPRLLEEQLVSVFEPPWNDRA